MRTGIAALAMAIAPTLAIPPPNFGFPEAPNDTALTVAFRQNSGNIGYVPVTEAELFGINIPANEPTLAVNTTAYQSLANYSGNYVTLMVDPDASYPNNPSNRFLLHWMQANMTQSTNLTVNQNLTLTGRHLVNMSAPVVPYARPAPPTNSSAHRYIIYTFRQPSNFSIPSQYAGYSAMNRTRFNLTNFIRDTSLGSPAAANYFYVSNQTDVPGNFIAAAGAQYPNASNSSSASGSPITSGDPYGPTGASRPSGSSSTSAAGAAMITGAGSLLGAGIVGLAALL
ncbi:phosphatidylethanolamine-binding pebp [Lecanosticta acicola]|uniref:Phosphatidylethanolamine-binding pebp n=1 Tax=Lecanosticta acicola TaxID=111012 RepID=A0AAI8Z207_9PEZI|nr:phosphatidylethanolamine-binding pebp [Lecanosticta acicola]